MMASKNEKQISASSIQDPYESTTLNCTSLSEVVMEIDGTQLKLKYTQQRRVTEENGVFSNTSDVKRVRSIKGGGKIWKQEGTSSSCKEVTQTLRGVSQPSLWRELEPWNGTRRSLDY